MSFLDIEASINNINVNALIVPVVVIFLLQILLRNDLIAVCLGGLILGWMLYQEYYIGIIINGIVLGIIASLFYYISHILIGVNSPNIVLPNILELIILAPITAIIGAVIKDKYASE